ncbi:MAG: hypothetical protein K9K79_01790 [Desulfohalobiaceae bacterium]|nr:hypothetical protein [Desulfohalobiaceae bacterium]
MTKQIHPSKIGPLYLGTIKLYVQRKWPELAGKFAQAAKVDKKQYQLEEAWEEVYAAVVIVHFIDLDQVLDQDAAEAVRLSIHENLMHESDDQVLLLNEFTVAASKAKKHGDDGIVGLSSLLCEKIFGGPCDEFWIGFMVATLEEFGMWWLESFFEDIEITQK